MFRKTGVLALALAALFAIGAAAAAQAHVFSNNSPNGRIVVTGETETLTQFVFSMGAAGEQKEVRCNRAPHEGTVDEGEVEEITLRPSFLECEMPSVGAATIRANHCAFVLKGKTAIVTGPPVEYAAGEIECATGSEMEIEVTGVCTMGIAAQKPTHGFQYQNIEYEVTKNVIAETPYVFTDTQKIKYTKIKGTGCGTLPNGGTGQDGSFGHFMFLFAREDKNKEPLSGTSKTTPTGTEEGDHVDFTLE